MNEKTVTTWVDIINQTIFKLINKNIDGSFIIINDLRKPYIDYFYLYNNIIGNHPFSIHEYIEFRLKICDSFSNYEPFCKFVVSPFENSEEFFTIGIRLKPIIVLDDNISIFDKWKRLIEKPDILNKIFYSWIVTVDEKFLKLKDKKILSFPFNIIIEETQPIIDYDYLYHIFNKNNPFSIKEYIILKLKSINFDYFYEPFLKYVMIGPFARDTEFFIIGIKNKNLYGTEEEIELYFKWKLKIDQCDILGKISELLRFGNTRFIIYTERTISSSINYNQLFNKIIERKKCSVKDYILTKVSFLKSPFKYLSFGKFIKDPIGSDIHLFQFGLKRKQELSPRLNELSPRFLIKLNTTT